MVDPSGPRRTGQAIIEANAGSSSEKAFKCRLQYVGHLSRPRCVDGPGMALVHCFHKPSSVSAVTYAMSAI